MTRYLIIGGTGTLGKELTRQIYQKEPDAEVTIFSRDELKQAEMKKDYPNAKYIIGDIRDKASLEIPFMYFPDVVFHVAALKHVDAMEANPDESVRTNIVGTMNVIFMCHAAGVKSAVFSSTDKAVDPVNVYGMCKGISEKLWIKQNDYNGGEFKVFRWGNVWGSRGSVIHAFSKSLKERNCAHVTHQQMSRFWIKIEDAVSFMLDTYRIEPSEVAIPNQMKAAKVTRVVASVARVLGVQNHSLIFTAVRPGEKIHEYLTSQHSRNPVCSETAQQYSDEELDEMVKATLCQS